MSDIFDTTKEIKSTFRATEDPSSVEGEFAESRFREWRYAVMEGEIEDLKREVSELRKTVNNRSINEVSDKRAEAMVTEFILEQRRVGRKTLKGPEISETLCLPADQVEKILDRFVQKKKLSRV